MPAALPVNEVFPGRLVEFHGDDEPLGRQEGVSED